MDDDFDIEIQDECEEPISSVQLPVNFLAFGEIEHDDVKVYIRQNVYKALEKYAAADVNHERGTIILGDYCEELGKTHVIISDYIEARYTDASASTLTFTHETWDYVHREHDLKFPEKKIVGWQHTHPSYGIFLSNYDLFIHENFFNLPFQVAYVIDPVQKLRGFFQWKNGKIEKLKGYYIYDEIGKTIKIDSVKPKTTKPVSTVNNSPLLKICMILLMLLTIGSIIAILRLSGTIRDQKHRQAELEQTMSSQGEQLQQLQDNLTVEQDNGENLDLTVSISELLEKLEAQQITLDNQQEVIDELTNTLEEMKATGTSEEEEYIIYTVKIGDTLGKICTSLSIDYWKNRDIILDLNNISDENIIIVGQTLIFPKNIKY